MSIETLAVPIKATRPMYAQRYEFPDGAIFLRLLSTEDGETEEFYKDIHGFFLPPDLMKKLNDPIDPFTRRVNRANQVISYGRLKENEEIVYLHPDQSKISQLHVWDNPVSFT